MSTPRYEFEYVTTSETSSQAALLGSTYWFDSGTEFSSLPVYYDTTEAYSYWSDGVDWFITEIENTGLPITRKYTQSGTTLTGAGGMDGTLEISDNTISDAWYRAETEAFESLRAFLNCTENDNCFRGFLPVQGDGEDFKYANSWQMTSGDSESFDMARLSGESGNWCSLRADVRIESLWKTRQLAMNFAGAVMAWLKSTENLAQTGNVTWCMLTRIPAEPQEYKTTGKHNRERYWLQSIELELVYKTETEYA